MARRLKWDNLLELLCDSMNEIMALHGSPGATVQSLSKKMHPILDAKCNETKFSMQFH
jgi:hypothetical protein